MSKKVLVVCTTDSMIWNFLVPHIKFLENKGFTVECACSRTGFYFDELIRKNGIVIHEIHFERSPFNLSNIKALFELCSLIKNGNFDVIHCHEPVGGALSRIAGKRYKKYVIYFAHGFHFFDGAPLKHWILYYTAEYILSFFTDCLVTICNEDYKRACKLHAKNCYLIPGIGVDFSKLDNINHSESRLEVRKELNLNIDDIVLVTVGELSIRKNQRVIIEALSIINDSNLKLLICGEGQMSDTLKEQVDSYNMRNQVMFLGFKRDVPKILAAADIFIFPSLWEGLGLAGIEAMYSGLPIIGSNRQGIKDYVIDGDTGFLFDPGDSNQLATIINNLSKDANLRKEIGNNGKTLVGKYSLENSVKAIEDIYTAENIL